MSVKVVVDLAVELVVVDGVVVEVVVEGAQVAQHVVR